jgi:hypothetical protein
LVRPDGFVDGGEDGREVAAILAEMAEIVSEDMRAALLGKEGRLFFCLPEGCLSESMAV